MGNLQTDTGITAIWKNWLNKWFFWLVSFGILVNASGLLLPVLEPDGALYAVIAKNMFLSGDYVNILVEGRDWLDKPHFPFWITTLSFRIFGIHSVAYKLPAFTFWMAGIYYTYALAKRIYNSETAQLAVLIYISVEHLILSNNDVRAEPYLTGQTIAATYYYFRAYRENRSIFILPGSLFLALAIMTKGLFIPVFILSGFMIEWIVKKNWKEILNPRWLLVILLVLLFITPELICLYIQFDLHPEKIVFGKTHVSGLKFFFWDSQFGRFLNTGPIKGNGDIFFYFHTILWAFLPWSPLLILMLYSKFKKIGMTALPATDYICSGICICGFIIFSLSKFQLPHYLNILYPFLSILVANYLMSSSEKVPRKTIAYIQNALCILFFAFCIFFGFVFGLRLPFLVSLVLIAMAYFIYRIFPGSQMQNIIGRSVLAILVLNLFLNALFYPELFKYQSGNSAAVYLNNNPHLAPVYTFSELMPEFSFEFYSSQQIKPMKVSDLDSLHKSITVFMPHSKMDSLRSDGFTIKEIQSFPHFHISRLTGAFINQKTRIKTIDSSVMATIIPK